jgi:hypothetical protein
LSIRTVIYPVSDLTQAKAVFGAMGQRLGQIHRTFLIEARPFGRRADLRLAPGFDYGALRPNTFFDAALANCY